MLRIAVHVSLLLTHACAQGPIVCMFDCDRVRICIRMRRCVRMRLRVCVRLRWRVRWLVHVRSWRARVFTLSRFVSSRALLNLGP
jgi:hypothetical protein